MVWGLSLEVCDALNCLILASYLTNHTRHTGYLTNANWRWCFGINLPIAVASLVAIFFVLRKELLGPQPIAELDETAETGRRSRYMARLKTIDFGGQLLFLFGFGLLILGLTWGGATYPWDSPAVIVSLVLGTIITLGFLYWQSLFSPGRMLSRKMPWQRPMIPWNILTNRDIGLLFYTEVGNGIGMFAVSWKHASSLRFVADH